MSAALPPGGGILVLGVDRVTVRKNLIENNDFFGVAVIDYCVAVAGTAFDCSLNPPEVETAPDDNQIIANALCEQRWHAPPGTLRQLLAADLAFLSPIPRTGRNEQLLQRQYAADAHHGVPDRQPVHVGLSPSSSRRSARDRNVARG